MRILNLYAGIGGNRKLWGDEHEITAVEYRDDIADVYRHYFLNDTVVVGDAHQYLLDNYKNFDFIWSSPPCQSHSSLRQNLAVRFRGTKAVYPDMKLWQEIIFMQHNVDCAWVVENVIPYYKPLIPGTKLQRHLCWSNFNITPIVLDQDVLRSAQIPDLQQRFGIDLSDFKVSEKRQVLRNCVHPELGLHILNCAIGNYSNTEQLSLFKEDKCTHQQ